jgi:hypothetical protein
MAKIVLTPEKTRLESNLERLESPLVLLSNKVASSVSDLNTAFNNLWTLSDEEILEIANHFGPQRMLEIFESHYRVGNYLNEICSLRGIENVSCITTKPRDFTVDPETGIISFYVEPVVVPEPWVDPRSLIDNPEYDERFDPMSENYDPEYAAANPYNPFPVIPEEPTDPPVEEPVIHDEPVDPPVEEPVDPPV